MPVGPLGLILVGMLYLAKPDIFRRGFWKRTSASQQMMTPDDNVIYMRLLGFICLIAGIFLLFRFHHS
jgi:hypothetical protein